MYLGLYCCVLAIVLLRVNKNPATVYAYMLSIYAWEQWLQAKDVFFVNNASFINVTSGIVVLIAVLITWLRNKGIFVNINYISRMILLLYCYVFISCFWSPVLDVSLFNFKTAFPYVVLVVLVTIYVYPVIQSAFLSNIYINSIIGYYVKNNKK